MDPHPDWSGGPLASPPGAAGAGGRRARWIALFVLADLLVVAGAVALWAHNGMLGRAEAVDAAWAQVESNLQRRADLVPRLVETLNRYVRHESELLVGVTRERGAALGAATGALEELRRAQTASAELRARLGGQAPPDAADLEALLRREAEVDQGVRVLLAVAESYPELRSADQFLELQSQLEGSENRINVARMAFNDAVRDYNQALVRLPTSLVAEARGLERRAYFRAAPEARVAGPLGFE